MINFTPDELEHTSAVIDATPMSSLEDRERKAYIMLKLVQEARKREAEQAEDLANTET